MGHQIFDDHGFQRIFAVARIAIHGVAAKTVDQDDDHRRNPAIADGRAHPADNTSAVPLGCSAAGRQIVQDRVALARLLVMGRKVDQVADVAVDSLTMKSLVERALERHAIRVHPIIRSVVRRQRSARLPWWDRRFRLSFRNRRTPTGCCPRQCGAEERKLSIADGIHYQNAVVAFDIGQKIKFVRNHVLDQDLVQLLAAVRLPVARRPSGSRSG